MQPELVTDNSNVEANVTVVTTDDKNDRQRLQNGTRIDCDCSTPPRAAAR